MKHPEAIIFDLDGTLWDAVPTYTRAWNLVFQERKLDRFLHPNDLYPLMGMTSEQYLEGVLPDLTPFEREDIYRQVVEKQYQIVPHEGGELFPFVREGLTMLSDKYKLMILSNCPPFIIRHFLAWSDLSNLFLDHLSYGESPQPKADNMMLLMKRNKISSAVYVGDTRSDGIQARKADLPFAFVSYGFGKTEDYDYKFDSFEELTEFFTK